MSYIECPECGQRALSVATRCPRCGHGFPSQLFLHPVSGPRVHRRRPVLVVAGAVVAVAAMVVVVRYRAASGPVTVPPASLVAAPVDTAPPVTLQPGSEAPDSAGDGPPPIAPAPSVAATPVGQQLQRYAATWVNVRGRRSTGAPTARVLSPGEAVQVDSLRAGWYRVVADGRTLGYVHGSYLDAAPPRKRR
jgi:hypothetical protein